MPGRSSTRLKVIAGAVAAATLIASHSSGRADASARAFSVQGNAQRVRIATADRVARKIERLTRETLPFVIGPDYRCEACDGAALAYQIESLGAAIRRWKTEHGPGDAD